MLPELFFIPIALSLFLIISFVSLILLFFSFLPTKPASFLPLLIFSFLIALFVAV